VKSLIHRLGSLKIAVGLLIALLAVMAAGTIVESARGPETAGRLVYGAWWFQVLEAAFVLNVLASIADHWPWGARRTGFVFTHSALVVILAGAAVTQLFKVEGHMAIWEGEKAQQFTREGTRAGELVALPFGIRLTAFELDTYPGTERPAMFRSRVVVEDPKEGRTLPAVIQMNQELSYGGWTFFQSSYHQTPQRDQTVLAVSKDPGQPIVFVGYGLLLIGMVTVLATRISQARAGASRVPQSKLQVLGKVAVLAAGFVLAGATARAATVPDAATVSELKRLPVQHDGRVMPLDTMAREAVGSITGRSRWHFERYIERAGRYDSMIRTRLGAAGLPQDMIYLAMIESGFAQSIRSRAGAIGLWQFMPETGRRYGLAVDNWVDERRDPFMATDAAIRFLGTTARSTATTPTSRWPTAPSCAARRATTCPS